MEHRDHPFRGIVLYHSEKAMKFLIFPKINHPAMIYYKLIFGIIFFCTFMLLLIRTGKKSQPNFLYLMSRLEILVGIAAGLFLIITAFKG